MSEGLAAFDAGDYRGAYGHWRELAEAGDLQAQIALAGLLESGAPGVARDLSAAAGWYRKAALAGEAVSQMNLAQLYAEGRGVQQDRVCALAWFSLAAAQGHRWATMRKKELAVVTSRAAQRAAAALAERIHTAGQSSTPQDPCSDTSTEK